MSTPTSSFAPFAPRGRAVRARTLGATLLAVSIASLAGAAARAMDYEDWPPDRRSDQVQLEFQVLQRVDGDRLRAHHDRLCAEAHMAGTPGDARLIETLADTFASMGLEVERHEIDAYLAFPGPASVEVLPALGMPIPLPLMEAPVEGDPHSTGDGAVPAFNAWSATGEAQGEVVYVNRGTKEDFERLRELGVDLRGKIAIARYGGNYRGFKARYAQEAGAAGLLIYTDPADSGWRRGVPYPEGGWANPTSIQRGSILELPYPGDPLTPFVEASADAPRLDPDTVALPRIPVQPIGWSAASEILRRMEGPALPREIRGAWQGGLPFAYRLEGGPALEVRVRVEQDRRIERTANVIARIPGTERPEEMVVLGCHHDAWGVGAGDPMAGLITIVEAARVLAQLAREGYAPKRTIVFAAWAAEEHGLIGSVEWVEAMRDELDAHAVAYLNLDMAAMGPNVRLSATPTLQRILEEATRMVPQAGVDMSEGVTVADRLTAGATRPTPFGFLGGGSDHVGFLCHVGVPCAAIGAGGSDGVSYHSAYDTPAWYRQVVGDDYGAAGMVTRLAAVAASRLANAPLVQLDPTRFPSAVAGHLDAIEERAGAIDERLEPERRNAVATGAPMPESVVDATAVAVAPLRERLAALAPRLARSVDRVRRLSARALLTPEDYDRANDRLMSAERAWIDPDGLPGRPWYRNLHAASDPFSGYAAWPLPALRFAVEAGDPAAIEHEAARLLAATSRLEAVAEGLEALADEVEAR